MPRCNNTLIKTKQRKGISIHKCRNTECPYYRKRLKGLSKKERKAFKKNKTLFKMHYIYRDFELSLAEQRYAKLQITRPTEKYRLFAACFRPHFDLSRQLRSVG